MLIKLIMILAGGGLGALARYTLGSQIDKNLNLSFPVGIFFVNLLGCFFIGLIVSMFENKFIFSENLKIFLIIGFLGTFGLLMVLIGMKTVKIIN